MAILVCKIKKHIFLWLEGLKITFKFKLSWQKSKVFCRAVVVAQLGTAVTSNIRGRQFKSIDDQNLS